MAATALVSVEEYLSSVYDPDRDYVDGELEDRNVGEKDHAKAQFRVARLLDNLGGWFVTIETRMKSRLPGSACPTCACTRRNRTNRFSRIPRC